MLRLVLVCALAAGGCQASADVPTTIFVYQIRGTARDSREPVDVVLGFTERGGTWTDELAFELTVVDGYTFLEAPALCSHPGRSIDVDYTWDVDGDPIDRQFFAFHMGVAPDNVLVYDSDSELALMLWWDAELEDAALAEVGPP